MRLDHEYVTSDAYQPDHGKYWRCGKCDLPLRDHRPILEQVSTDAMARRVNITLTHFEGNTALMLATITCLKWSPESYWCDIDADFGYIPCVHQEASK